MSTPMITSIAPSEGPSTGGTQVSIAGSGLGTATAEEVLFGTLPATAVVSASDSLLVVDSPPSSVLGTVPLSVATPNGTAQWPNGFDYSMTVTSILPASGPVAGGTVLTIRGSGFLQVFGIQFGSTTADTMVVTDDTHLTVITPPATAPGNTDLTFLGLTGEIAYIEMGSFTYTAAPASAPPSPNGSTAGGPNASTPGATTGAPSGPGANTAGAQQPPGSQPGSAPTSQGKAPAGQTPPDNTPPGKPPQAPTATDKPPQAPAATDKPPADKPPPGGPPSLPAGAGSTPTPGGYIPGGLMSVQGGQTGLGGTAGTGAGFGVGTLLPGGGGSAPPSNLPYYTDPGLTAQLVQTLIGLVQSAASPDAIEAQNMILRRMALEGDVVGSRIPPPRNISEFGGYLNLLDTLDEPTMREQALAGALGVAGPPVPLGWITNQQPLSMVAVPNDRPAVHAQPTFPLSVLVRSDFVAGVQSALKTLHSYGATLPFTSPAVITLPHGGTGSTVPNPVLFYLGRTLTIAPSAALGNPAADPVAIISPDGGLTHCFLASQVLAPGTFQVPPADVEAVQATPAASALTQLNQVEFVPIASILAAAGFYPPSPFPVPANSGQTAWASLSNTTGLVAGTTRLADELSLLYREDQIAASAFAAMLAWTWNGSTFGP